MTVKIQAILRITGSPVEMRTLHIPNFNDHITVFIFISDECLMDSSFRSNFRAERTPETQDVSAVRAELVSSIRDAPSSQLSNLNCSNFSLRQFLKKQNEREVTEESCWAEGRSCCGPSDSSVLELGLQLESIL